MYYVFYVGKSNLLRGEKRYVFMYEVYVCTCMYLCEILYAMCAHARVEACVRFSCLVQINELAWTGCGFY